MKRKILSLVMALVLCLGLLPGTAAADGEVAETSETPEESQSDVTIYAKLPDGWTNVYCYAYFENGNPDDKKENSDEGWPGVSLSKPDENLGDGYWCYNVPKGLIYIIFNNGSGGSGNQYPTGDGLTYNSSGTWLLDYDGTNSSDLVKHGGANHLYKNTEGVYECVVCGAEKPNDLDLSSIGSLGSLDKDGYEWKNNTLTLKAGATFGKVTLPDDTVTIIVNGDCRIQELVAYNTEGHSSPQKTQLTISGTGTLTVQDKISMVGGNHNSLTVEKGACLEAKGGLGIGASGSVDSTVTVEGRLVADGGDGTALSAGQIIVKSNGSLEVSGMFGVSANGVSENNGGGGGDGSSNATSNFTDAFILEEGASFKANCKDDSILVGASVEYLQQQIPEDVANDEKGAWLQNNIQKIINSIINILPGYLPDGVKVEGK